MSKEEREETLNEIQMYSRTMLDFSLALRNQLEFQRLLEASSIEGTQVTGSEVSSLESSPTLQPVTSAGLKISVNAGVAAWQVWFSRVIIWAH